ncbi:MAG TPA: hypothetical protein VMT37_12315 [Solirubrobacterales bacterium]|nr:hypothetical protein [Solirubrobacterales bacterium]
MKVWANLRQGPVYVSRRIAYKLYERRHPDEPWLAQGAVRFFDRELPRDGAGFEWGSGRSTAWFAARLAGLTSIEMDEDWYEIVRGRVNGNVDLRHIAIEHGRHEQTPDFPEPTPRYVAAIDEFDDGSLDFVLVDGHYRHACVREALPKVKPGGLLAIDNTNWLPNLSEWRVPSEWPVVHQSENVMTQTTVWRAPI